MIKCCSVCDEPLEGRRRKYCSTKCYDKAENRKFQNYELQKARGLKRKIDIVLLKGGQCKCGYKRNLSALTFHHRNPIDKLFDLSIRNLSNRTWKSILKELEKCDLLCSNCHREVENPELDNIIPA